MQERAIRKVKGHVAPFTSGNVKARLRLKSAL